ncbi:protein of unknown function [Stenotrophomonas maltophilia]|nr:protein of unknown function [Stenotrophomonas maltophilia]
MSTKVDTYQERQAPILVGIGSVSTKVDTYQQQRNSVEGGVGPVAGV